MIKIWVIETSNWLFKKYVSNEFHANKCFLISFRLWFSANILFYYIIFCCCCCNIGNLSTKKWMMNYCNGQLIGFDKIFTLWCNAFICHTLCTWVSFMAITSNWPTDVSFRCAHISIDYFTSRIIISSNEKNWRRTNRFIVCTQCIMQ